MVWRTALVWAFVAGSYVAVAFVSGGARADTYPAREHSAFASLPYYTLESYFAAWKAAQSTCAAPATCTFTSANPSSHNQSTSYTIQYQRVASGVTTNPTTSAGSVLSCPWGGTLAGSRPNMYCNNAAACSSGYERLPAGIGETSSQCVPVCVAPQTRSPTTQQCVDPPCTKGALGPSGYFEAGSVSTASVPAVTCGGGCLHAFVGECPAGRVLVSGSYTYFCLGAYEGLGSTCTEGAALPSPSSSLPPDSCGVGQTLGQVNGQNFCVGSTGVVQDPNTPTPSKASSTTTVTDPNTQVTTETTVSDDPGTNTRTTTTVVSGPGIPTTTSETKQPLDPTKPMDEGGGFCEENPDSVVCKESAWAGDCGAFTCDGDAIQCAIGRELHRHRCDGQEAAGAGAAAVAASIYGGADDPVVSPFHSSKRTAVEVPFLEVESVFDDGGGCPAPGSFSVMGVAYELDYAPLCDLGEIVGHLVVVLASLAAARVVVGGL